MKRFLLFIVISIVLASAVCAGDIAGDRIVMVLPPMEYKDSEYRTLRKIFENSGAVVDVASTTTDEVESANKKKVVYPDLLIIDVDVYDYDAIILVGGPGITAYFDYEPLFALLDEMNQEGRVIGALGLAPEVLARAGILKGRRATVTKSSIRLIRELGARYWPRQVVRDGNIVTGIGPWATKSFAYSVIKALMYNE